jgi:hypothetical protein
MNILGDGEFSAGYYVIIWEFYSSLAAVRVNMSELWSEGVWLHKPVVHRPPIHLRYSARRDET